MANPAASHDFELDRPPYKILFRAGVFQKSRSAGLSFGKFSIEFGQRLWLVFLAIGQVALVGV